MTSEVIFTFYVSSAIALVAALVPSRQASRVDPVQALRVN
jgi:ABC-type lipoprotein release transport system permease subunit